MSSKPQISLWVPFSYFRLMSPGAIVLFSVWPRTRQKFEVLI